MNHSPRTKNYVLALVVITVILVGGYFIKAKSLDTDSTNRTGKVARETLIQRVTIAGIAEPLRSTVVTAPYDGYVKKIFVKLGQSVRAGEPVVSISQSLLTPENVFPIRAPFSGTVTQVVKNEGQYARQNDPKEFILRIDDMTKMYIYANAPEIDIVKIKPKLESVIKVSAVLSRNYAGVVTDISQAATVKEQWGGRSQVEFLVKIEITDLDPQLKPGMSAVVDIITNKKEAVLTLGHEFVQRENENYFVFLKDGSKKNIKVGLQNESVFEIIEGLTEGQEVQQVDFLKLIESER